jgi:LMBR1 domain-containing protein 1
LLLTDFFLAVYLVVFITTLFRTPKLDLSEVDADLEEEGKYSICKVYEIDINILSTEEEGLLASTGRRFNATWQDITGRSKQRMAKYGATDTSHDDRSGVGPSR